MAVLYNRQLHQSEKDAIHTAANGDKAEEDKLTKAACYAVQCWAEFPPNSTAYYDNYVGPRSCRHDRTEYKQHTGDWTIAQTKFIDDSDKTDVRWKFRAAGLPSERGCESK